MSASLSRALRGRPRLGLRAVLLLCLLQVTANVVARETVTLWFWGAPPAYKRALETNLTTPFNASQDKYRLEIEYRASVDNDVRIALLAGKGPDLVYTSGPADAARLAHAGKLAPLDAYALRYRWSDRLLAPVLAVCQQFGHLYCLPPSVTADGMFYNAAVLRENGWQVPETSSDVERIMKAAQKMGLYASVTGNADWQPINENYVSTFFNLMAGPDTLRELLSGRGDWGSARMLAATRELKRWYQAGYLGGNDYFSLNFDSAISLLQQRKAPFFFAPSFSFQWAGSHFKGADADNFKFAPFPQLDKRVPFPLFPIGSAFTFSINSQSTVKDGAAQVLDMMMSASFATQMAKVWPGYWSIPLKDFPFDEHATGIEKGYDDAMRQIIAGIRSGHYGYKLAGYFPPATTDLFVEDIEAVWLGTETPEVMLSKASTTFKSEYRRGFVSQIVAPAR